MCLFRRCHCFRIICGSQNVRNVSLTANVALCGRMLRDFAVPEIVTCFHKEKLKIFYIIENKIDNCIIINRANKKNCEKSKFGKTLSKYNSFQNNFYFSDLQFLFMNLTHSIENNHQNYLLHHNFLLIIINLFSIIINKLFYYLY